MDGFGWIPDIRNLCDPSGISIGDRLLLVRDSRLAHQNGGLEITWLFRCMKLVRITATKCSHGGDLNAPNCSVAQSTAPDSVETTKVFWEVGNGVCNFAGIRANRKSEGGRK